MDATVTRRNGQAVGAKPLVVPAVALCVGFAFLAAAFCRAEKQPEGEVTLADLQQGLVEDFRAVSAAARKWEEAAVKKAKAGIQEVTKKGNELYQDSQDAKKYLKEKAKSTGHRLSGIVNESASAAGSGLVKIAQWMGVYYEFLMIKAKQGTAKALEWLKKANIDVYRTVVKERSRAMRGSARSE